MGGMIEQEQAKVVFRLHLDVSMMRVKKGVYNRTDCLLQWVRSIDDTDIHDWIRRIREKGGGHNGYYNPMLIGNGGWMGW